MNWVEPQRKIMELLVELIVPQDRQEEARTVLARARSAQPVVLRTVRRTRDGGTIPVDVSIRSVSDEAGSVQVLVVRERDVQRLTEAQASEEMFRGLLEAAPDAMVIVDATGRITLVNEQLVKLFCYTRDQLLGQTIEILVPERLREVHASFRSRSA